MSGQGGQKPTSQDSGSRLQNGFIQVLILLAAIIGGLLVVLTTITVCSFVMKQLKVLKRRLLTYIRQRSQLSDTAGVDSTVTTGCSGVSVPFLRVASTVEGPALCCVTLMSAGNGGANDGDVAETSGGIPTCRTPSSTERKASLTEVSTINEIDMAFAKYKGVLEAGYSTDSEETSALLGTSTSISSTSGAPCSSGGQAPVSHTSRPPLRVLESFSSDSASGGSHQPSSSMQPSSTADANQFLSPQPTSAAMRLTVVRPGALRNSTRSSSDTSAGAASGSLDRDSQDGGVSRRTATRRSSSMEESGTGSHIINRTTASGQSRHVSFLFSSVDDDDAATAPRQRRDFIEPSAVEVSISGSAAVAAGLHRDCDGVSSDAIVGVVPTTRKEPHGTILQRAQQQSMSQQQQQRQQHLTRMPTKLGEFYTPSYPPSTSTPFNSYGCHQQQQHPPAAGAEGVRQREDTQTVARSPKQVRRRSSLQQPETIVMAEVHREFAPTPSFDQRPSTLSPEFAASSMRRTSFVNSDQRSLANLEDATTTSGRPPTSRIGVAGVSGRVSPRLAAVAAMEYGCGGNEKRQGHWSSLEQTRLGVRGRSPGTGETGAWPLTSGTTAEDPRSVTRRVRSCEDRRLLERQREVNRNSRPHPQQSQLTLAQQRRRWMKASDPLRITEFSSCAGDDDDDNDGVDDGVECNTFDGGDLEKMSTSADKRLQKSTWSPEFSRAATKLRRERDRRLPVIHHVQCNASGSQIQQLAAPPAGHHVTSHPHIHAVPLSSSHHKQLPGSRLQPQSDQSQSGIYATRSVDRQETRDGSRGGGNSGRFWNDSRQTRSLEAASRLPPQKQSVVNDDVTVTSVSSRSHPQRQQLKPGATLSSTSERRTLPAIPTSPNAWQPEANVAKETRRQQQQQQQQQPVAMETTPTQSRRRQYGIAVISNRSHLIQHQSLQNQTSSTCVVENARTAAGSLAVGSMAGNSVRSTTAENSFDSVPTDYDASDTSRSRSGDPVTTTSIESSSSAPGYGTMTATTAGSGGGAGASFGSGGGGGTHSNNCSVDTEDSTDKSGGTSGTSGGHRLHQMRDDSGYKSLETQQSLGRTTAGVVTAAAWVARIRSRSVDRESAVGGSGHLLSVGTDTTTRLAHSAAPTPSHKSLEGPHATFLFPPKPAAENLKPEISLTKRSGNDDVTLEKSAETSMSGIGSGSSLFPTAVTKLGGQSLTSLFWRPVRAKSDERPTMSVVLNVIGGRSLPADIKQEVQPSQLDQQNTNLSPQTGTTETSLFEKFALQTHTVGRALSSGFDRIRQQAGSILSKSGSGIGSMDDEGATAVSAVVSKDVPVVNIQAALSIDSAERRRSSVISVRADLDPADELATKDTRKLTLESSRSRSASGASVTPHGGGTGYSGSKMRARSAETGRSPPSVAFAMSKEVEFVPIKLHGRGPAAAAPALDPVGTSYFQHQSQLSQQHQLQQQQHFGGSNTTTRNALSNVCSVSGGSSTVVSRSGSDYRGVSRATTTTRDCHVTQPIATTRVDQRPLAPSTDAAPISVHRSAVSAASVMTSSSSQGKRTTSSTYPVPAAVIDTSSDFRRGSAKTASKKRREYRSRKQIEEVQGSLGTASTGGGTHSSTAAVADDVACLDPAHQMTSSSSTSQTTSTGSVEQPSTNTSSGGPLCGSITSEGSSTSACDMQYVDGGYDIGLDIAADGGRTGTSRRTLSSTGRDYSIDAKTDAVFNEFLKYDPSLAGGVATVSTSTSAINQPRPRRKCPTDLQLPVETGAILRKQLTIDWTTSERARTVVGNASSRVLQPEAEMQTIRRSPAPPIRSRSASVTEAAKHVPLLPGGTGGMKQVRYGRTAGEHHSAQTVSICHVQLSGSIEEEDEGDGD